MAKKSHFLSGAIFGVALGAATALFTTSKRGKELRLDALDKYNDFRDDPQGVIDNFKDYSLDRFNSVKEKFDSGEYSAEKAKEYLLSKRDEIKEMVDSGELSVDSVRELLAKTRTGLSERFSSSFAKGDDIEDGDLTVDYSWTEEENEEGFEDF